jgi:proline iminopeptidase
MSPILRCPLGARFLISLVLSACGSSAPPAAEPAPLAVTTTTAAAGDVTLFIRSVGNPAASPPLVIVHGGAGYSHDYLTGLDRLAGPDRRVVYYDQRGCGRSTTPAGDHWGLDAQVADLEAVRVALGVARLDLLGHSWGGVPAMAYAAAHPDRVAHLVLLGSLPPAAAQMATVTTGWPERRKRLPAQPPAAPGDCSPSLPFWFADPRDPRIASIQVSCTKLAQDRTRAAVGDWDLRASLGAIDVPTLALTGAADPLATATEAASAAIRGARFTALSGCGHFPYIECPDELDRALRAFLAR